jgi:hypothetical protein
MEMNGISTLPLTDLSNVAKPLLKDLRMVG